MTALAGADLVRLEAHYSNGRQHVTRRKVSPLDPRGPDVSKMRGHMCSGGRMGPKCFYAETYASVLAPYVDRRFVLVELGVLLGAGLAMWCDVFPKARIIGLDVDPARFDVAMLLGRRAFRYNHPEVHYLDELAADAADRLERILDGEKIDVFIDDALHNDDSILTALAWAKPHLAQDCLYCIEDNETVAPKVFATHLDFEVERHGKLTICRRQ